MADLINIELKNANGRIVDLQVAEIVSIDGKPFDGTPDSIRDVLLNLSARVDQLERILGAQLQRDQ